MPRIVSVWLPRWPILRFLAAQRSASPEAIDDSRPFVLSVEGPGGGLIAAANRAAAAAGLASGDRLADARARCGPLQVRPADPAADDAALRRLALWATRYAPAVTAWGEAEGADGLFIDVAGADHLLGGEEKLLADLDARLRRFGLPARLAVAGTAGAAWALSRFSRIPRPILPTGAEAAALAPLPVAALRLPAGTREPLRRLGFKRVGDLLDKPRAPFAARFDKGLLRRLDQALGRAPEALTWLAPPPAYRALRQLLEPVLTQDAVVTVARRLMADLAPQLKRDGMGARTLELALYRVDGAVRTVDIGLAQATRDPAHVARLIGLKLERLGEAVDAGFGFEAFALSVIGAEVLDERQSGFASAAAIDLAERRTALVDSLRQRLGPRSVQVLAPVASHVPERSQAARCIGEAPPAWPAPDGSRLRPVLLLAAPEPADIVALLPDGPPRRLRWRGTTHAIARLQGPERIADEWWHAPPVRASTSRTTTSAVMAGLDPAIHATIAGAGEHTGEGRAGAGYRRDPGRDRMRSRPDGRDKLGHDSGLPAHPPADAPLPSIPAWQIRDYVLAEDEAGRRFWLFRDVGASPPRWFVHGLFA